MHDVVFCDDCLNVLPGLANDSVHLILSDIPYGIGVDEWDVLHANTNSALLGSSPAQQKAGAVFQKRGKPLNGWSAADREIPLQYYQSCMAWAPHWLRVLKPGGSAIVFAGRRLSHRCLSHLRTQASRSRTCLLGCVTQRRIARRESVLCSNAEVMRQHQASGKGGVLEIFVPSLSLSSGSPSHMRSVEPSQTMCWSTAWGPFTKRRL